MKVEEEAVRVVRVVWYTHIASGFIVVVCPCVFIYIYVCVCVCV
jgi:hypothetical protein